MVDWPGPWCRPPRVTRRSFLERGGRLAAGVLGAPLVLRLSGCGDASGHAGRGDVDASARATFAGAGGGVSAPGDAGLAAPREASAPAPDAAAGGDRPLLAPNAVLLGLYPGDGDAAVAQAVRRLDFGWLRGGETVLIKVACNSGNRHPAVTAPSGVRAMVAELRARGAGRVIVADQSGVEVVRRTASSRFGSTRQNFASNGLLDAAAEAELVFFDDGEWDAGYFAATLPDGHHWPRGLRLARTVLEADHIVYMPRIGAHMLAGLTLAHKCAIGWLRDDSRHDLHNDAQAFYEKYAEISYATEIRERLRLVVTLSEKVLLFGGPDVGTEYVMAPALVLASDSLANHDAVACSVLVTLQGRAGLTPSGMLYDPRGAPLINGLFAAGTGVGGLDVAGPWQSGSPSTSYTAHGFEGSVDGDRAIARGWALSGGKPASVELSLDGEPPSEALRGGLESHGQGLYRLVS